MTDREQSGFTGEQLGKWMLQHRIGKGGMSEVYHAQHVDTQQIGAVKILMLEGTVNDDMTERFYHEVHILRRLKHPNILDVFEFGFEQDIGFYLVMELLQGCSLYEYLLGHRGDMPLEHIYAIISQICDALAFAHEKEIIHRDIKPENIFLCGGPETLEHVKVLDFGIAKFQLGESARLTKGGATLGTPHYISPEQARGDSVGPAADIYSLSVLLFEMLTGNDVFEATSPLEYLMRHAYTEPPKISQSRTDIIYPEPLVDLVDKGLAKQPDDRPLSMGQLKEWLYQAITGQALARATIPMKPAPKDTLVAGSYHIETSSQRPQSAESEIKPLKLGGEKSRGRQEPSQDDKGLSRLENLQSSGSGTVKAKALPPSKEKPSRRVASPESGEAEPAPKAAWQAPVAIGAIIVLVAAISSILTYKLLSRGPDATTPRPAVTRQPLKKASKRIVTAPRKELRDASAARPGETPPQPDAAAPDAPKARPDAPRAKPPVMRPLVKKNWKALIKQKLKQARREPPPQDAGAARRTPPPKRR